MELPVLSQPLVASLIGTPPMTPVSCDEQTTSTPSSVPSLRTPRKLQHPQRSTVSESRRDSVIVSFRLIQHEDQSLPSLSISTTSLMRCRPSRAKRRLFTNGYYDSFDYSDLDIREQKLSRLSLSRMRKSKCSPIRSEMDGIDADDEMEQPAFSVNYLSPPYSPAEESSTGETSPLQNNPSLRIQRSRVSSNAVAAATPKVKTCASCKTKKTPLWRDSDDGTPYCNACGIRFKKYHVRCSACFYIPRKDEKVNNSCCLCGSRLVHCRHH